MSKKCCNHKKSSIGGQAVLEGIMMRGSRAMATAVRDEEGIIRVESKRLKDSKKRNWFLRLPIIRGVVAFISSLFDGTSVLMRSAEVYGQGEPSRFEKWLSNKLKINVMTVISVISLIVALFLAVFLFVWLPQTVRILIEKLFNTTFDVLAKNLIEGVLKLFVFLSYILLCSLLPDIKRTFMYHGAEHKTISCYEKDLPLTIENVKKCTRIHDRCGTSFIVFVMLISILVFACFEALIGTYITGALRVLCKLLILPFVAGVSYELLKGLAKTNFWLFYPLKVPGLLLQRITTREPDEKMIEVAITAFSKVMQMEEDETIPEERFVLPMKQSALVESVSKKLAKFGITEQAEVEWIISLSLGISRDRVYEEGFVKASLVEKVEKLVDERITGRPLWYCIGDTEFYGYKILVDERVLIPRPETEILVETALKYINKDSSVLDLCTGSGAIAIAIKKQTDAVVTASDVSEKAIDLAKENAKINNVDVEFLCGNMFETVLERQFDVILSNPPYINSFDLETLQKEVKDFEPIIALDGGKDGLDFYRIIAKNAEKHLNKNGVLIMECGINQAEQICDLLKGFSSVSVVKDLENIDRIVLAVL